MLFIKRCTPKRGSPPEIRAIGKIITLHNPLEEYRKINEFLTANQNKKILFLELGVGRMTPMFIQEPFWNLTYSLPQAYYITINPKDALLPQALSQKGRAIKEDIAAVLQDAAAHMSGKEDSSCMI